VLASACELSERMRTDGTQYDQLLITGGVKKLKPRGDCESENPIADSATFGDLTIVLMGSNPWLAPGVF